MGTMDTLTSRGTQEKNVFASSQGRGIVKLRLVMMTLTNQKNILLLMMTMPTTSLMVLPKYCFFQVVIQGTPIEAVNTCKHKKQIYVKSLTLKISHRPTIQQCNNTSNTYTYNNTRTNNNGNNNTRKNNSNNNTGNNNS